MPATAATLAIGRAVPPNAKPSPALTNAPIVNAAAP